MPHSICLFNLFFDTVSSRVVYLWLAVGRLGDIMEHPLLMDYGPIPGWLILAVIGLVSVSFFLYQVWKATKLVMVGQPDDRFDNWPARIKEVITGWLGQKKVLQDRIAGGIHVLMFWGFLMLSTDMFDLATANWFSHNVLPDVVRGPWNLVVETGYTIALVGCVAALTRRVVFTPEKLKGKSQLEGNVILLLIMTITITSFFVEAGDCLLYTSDAADE